MNFSMPPGTKLRPRKYSLHTTVWMDHIEHDVHGEGVDLESILEDAQFNHPGIGNGTPFRHIGELPQDLFDQVTQDFTEQLAVMP